MGLGPYSNKRFTRVSSIIILVDYRIEDFYNGKGSAWGCHSHKENSLGFTICKTDEKGAKDKEQNCITCHMPQVKGSATNIRVSQTHAFHGFAGAINRS